MLQFFITHCKHKWSQPQEITIMYCHVLSYNDIYGYNYENMTNMTIHVQPHRRAQEDAWPRCKQIS